ncbi:type II toxin-antitoxin system RelE/ParE family toxin [Parachlamydia sp. AcF125]|uniref:type II toxin-antitoxin system RelE/ParE family toxin n=1 Tax=Parachlamydia sp. AcF125 TaxID=2795736 RepID=UPI0020169100|nr:type II toxin-antitoxin system RelE/ParE family toxin [Parachlamydia sp. AcF125]
MKRLFWIGSSREDLKEFPDEVRNEMGHGLYLAQMGERHNHAKTLSGLGSAKIIEIRENDRSGTYRVVYSVEMEEFIFVLHAFQKKSKSGISTPKQDVNLIKRRLKEAESLYKELTRENNNEKKDQI